MKALLNTVNGPSSTPRGYLGHRLPLRWRLARGPITRPTLAQYAFAYRVPMHMLAAAPTRKRNKRNGHHHGNGHTNGHKATPTLAEHPASASLSELIAVELADLVREHKAAMAAMRREHNGHGQHVAHQPTLAEHLVSASFAERVAAAQALGVDAVWYSMIEPLVGNGKAAE
jgi:hypothetical protein